MFYRTRLGEKCFASCNEEPGTSACLPITDRAICSVRICHQKWQGCPISLKACFAHRFFVAAIHEKKKNNKVQSRYPLQSWKLEQGLFKSRTGLIRAQQATTKCKLCSCRSCRPTLGSNTSVRLAVPPQLWRSSQEFQNVCTMYVCVNDFVTLPTLLVALPFS